MFIGETKGETKTKGGIKARQGGNKVYFESDEEPLMSYEQPPRPSSSKYHQGGWPVLSEVGGVLVVGSCW